MSAMTRDQFAARWDKDEHGDNISVDEIAECAQAWGLYAAPPTHPIRVVLAAVVKESGAKT